MKHIFYPFVLLVRFICFCILCSIGGLLLFGLNSCSFQNTTEKNIQETDSKEKNAKKHTDTTETKSESSKKHPISLLIWAGTFCSHCQNEIPKIEKKIYEQYKDQINIQIYVTDAAQGNIFDTQVPQTGTVKYSYKDFTHEECKYIPTWVLIKENAEDKIELLEKSCGNQKDVDRIIEVLETELSS